MKLLGVICFVMFSQLAHSQTVLSMGNDHKYIYYEVVIDTGLTKDSLMLRSKNFLEKNHDQDFKITIEEDDTLVAEATFVVDKTILVASHPSGQVNYKFTFNAKNGRYRFWLTDFVYTPYIRDRYGNFVPKSNFGKPLEKVPGKLKSAEWNAILIASGAKTKEMGEEFKKFMAAKLLLPPVIAVPKASVKADW